MGGQREKRSWTPARQACEHAAATVRLMRSALMACAFTPQLVPVSKLVSMAAAH